MLPLMLGAEAEERGGAEGGAEGEAEEEAGGRMLNSIRLPSRVPLSPPTPGRCG